MLNDERKAESKINIMSSFNKLKYKKERNLSTTSTFCSFITKDSDEICNKIKTLSFINLIKGSNSNSKSLSPKRNLSLKKLNFNIKNEKNKSKSRTNDISSKKNEKNNKNKKSKNPKNDEYSQNHHLNILNKFAPKLPELLNYEQNFEPKANNYSNEYSSLKKIKVLNVFFGHLMTVKEKKFKNKKYIKTSITQRTKEKLLTYVYYKPCNFS